MSLSSIAILIAAAVIFLVVYYYEDRFNSDSAEKFTIWLFSSVLFALLPLVFSAGVLLMEGRQIKLPDMLAHGELLIVSAGIAADATGQALLGNISKGLSRILSSASCVVILALSSYCFAFVSISPTVQIDTANVAELSVTIFFLTMLTSIPVVLMSIKSEAV